MTEFCCECGRKTADDKKLLCAECWLRIFGKKRLRGDC